MKQAETQLTSLKTPSPAPPQARSTGARQPQGQPRSMQQLREERDRLQENLTALDHKILAAKLDLSHMHRADEKDLWESQLIILQASSAYAAVCCVGAGHHRWRGTLLGASRVTFDVQDDSEHIQRADEKDLWELQLSFLRAGAA